MFGTMGGWTHGSLSVLGGEQQQTRTTRLVMTFPCENAAHLANRPIARQSHLFQPLISIPFDIPSMEVFGMGETSRKGQDDER